MVDVGRIRESYSPRWDPVSRRLFVTPPGAGREVPIPFTPRKNVILTFGDAAVAARARAIDGPDGPAALARLREAGIPAWSYREFYGLLLSPEEFAEARRGREPDDRSAAYLAAVREGIGLVGRKDEDCGDGERLAVESTMDVGAVSPAEVGQLPDGRWAVQWSVRYEIDAFNTTTLYFDHRPTRAQVEKAILADEIETHLALRCRYDPTFTCRECGRAGVHWLDIDPQDNRGLREKFESFKERYCGC